MNEKQGFWKSLNWDDAVFNDALNNSMFDYDDPFLSVTRNVTSTEEDLTGEINDIFVFSGLPKTVVDIDIDEYIDDYHEEYDYEICITMNKASIKEMYFTHPSNNITEFIKELEHMVRKAFDNIT